MEELLSHRLAKKICIFIDLCFLIIHVGMLILFSFFRVTPLIYFNIFSIFFYSVLPVCIIKDKLRFFVLFGYIEVLIHMTFASLLTGWECGYSVTLIGMNVLVFFAEYFGRSIKGNYVKALPLSILSMCAYTATYFFDKKNGAYYELPDQVVYRMQIMWGIVVFVITIFILQLFTLLSFQSEQLLSEEATKDKLTGLPNRHYLSKYEKERMKEGGWIAMVDIDDFKKINDTYGHLFGDYILQELAKIIERSLDDTLVCRWGGEEFLLIGKNTDIFMVRQKLEELRRKIEEYYFQNDGLSTKLTVTVGFTFYEPGANMNEVIKIADKKLYVGKYGGKNRVIA